MKKLIVYPVVCLLVVGAAFALNPTPEQHREKIEKVIASRSKLDSLFGVGAFKAFASRYTSLGVASYTRVDKELTSFGMFGVVFVLD